MTDQVDTPRSQNLAQGLLSKLNDMGIDELLQIVVEAGASDLHLHVPSRPVLRIDGRLIALEDLPNLTPQDVEKTLTEVTTERQREAFESERELDFAYGVPGVGRFRVNACFQRGSISLSFRRVNVDIPDIEELGLPGVCKALALRQQGLVLITGQTGSGKSTTLAAMIEYLNVTEPRRVVTVEDPIEYLFRNKKCLITQREVGSDTQAFSAAVKRAIRQDPDVIVVGEMRDQDTAATALTAAEAGQLVLSTIHAPSAPQAIDRMIDLFPPYQQEQVRAGLSIALEGVLYQVLLPRSDGQGRVIAVEVMLGTNAIRNLIRDAKTNQMVTVIQTGAQFGMRTLDQALIDLYRRGQITYDEAFLRCRNPDVFKQRMAEIGT